MQELHRWAAPSTCNVYTYTARPTRFQTPLCHCARCHLQYYLTTSLRKLSYGRHCASSALGQTTPLCILLHANGHDSAPQMYPSAQDSTASTLTMTMIQRK